MHRRKRKILGIGNLFNEGNIMEQKQKGRVAGTKNKTWCGVPISLYRRKKQELSKEDFRQWWFKKTGRSLCIREDKPLPATTTQLDDMLARVDRQMGQLRADRDQYKAMFAAAAQKIEQLENRSWIQRLFNSKV